MSEMKLSEAIRLGAMMRPQGFYGFYSSATVHVVGDVLALRDLRTGSCALGAAMEAAGCPVRPITEHDHGAPVRANGHKASTTTEVPASWFSLLQHSRACPVCGVELITQQIIAHLNDDHRWTREAIADFVTAIEASDPVPQTPEGHMNETTTI